MAGMSEAQSQLSAQTETIFLALLALGALALGLAMTLTVMEGLPHLEDEIAYLYQARVFAGGALCGPLSPDVEAFSTPFLVNLGDCRLGKYPIGWPLLLALGEGIGLGWLLNPLLGVALTLVTYALARDLFGQRTAQAAAILCISSPFFLIQAGTLMAHLSGALWTAVFALSLLKIEREFNAEGLRRPVPNPVRDSPGAQHQRTRHYAPGIGVASSPGAWALIAGLALGMLALTRPTTAIAVGLPFGAYLLWRLAQGQITPLILLILGGSALLVAAMQPLFLWITTGSPSTNLYTLIWPFDRLGFGPGFGPYEGHTLRQGLITTGQDLRLWASELFGLPALSWLPLLIGLLRLVRRPLPGRHEWSWLLLTPLLLLAALHTAYWVGAQVYGPRYYFEVHALLCALAGAGIAGAGDSRREPPGTLTLAAVLLVMALTSATLYLPGRVAYWRALYGIDRAPVAQWEQLRGDQPALIFVAGTRWVDYAAFFALNDPWYAGPAIAAHDLGPANNARLAREFPGRLLFYFDGRQLMRCQTSACAGP